MPALITFFTLRVRLRAFLPARDFWNFAARRALLACSNPSMHVCNRANERVSMCVCVRALGAHCSSHAGSVAPASSLVFAELVAHLLAPVSDYYSAAPCRAACTLPHSSPTYAARIELQCLVFVTPRPLLELASPVHSQRTSCNEHDLVTHKFKHTQEKGRGVQRQRQGRCSCRG